MKETCKAQKIFDLLKNEYSNVIGTALKFNSDFELLVATILSAQCTDKRVKKVTRVLFKRYMSLKDYADAELEELEKIIKSTGFYHNKAKFIKEAAKKILEDFNSEIPRSMEEMTKIPGVARKTANIVLSNAFNIIEGVAVDTHVMRLSKRLGFSKEKNREKIERDLMKLFPKEQWFDLSNLLIAHGRKVCLARRPKCDECFLDHTCDSAYAFE